MSISMTAEERAATEAYKADLTKQFDQNVVVMGRAGAEGDIDRYNECVAEARILYREIAEAEHALATGTLPF
jgi:hypothetical protein